VEFINVIATNEAFGLGVPVHLSQLNANIPRRSSQDDAIDHGIWYCHANDRRPNANWNMRDGVVNAKKIVCLPARLCGAIIV
jgi:hypothetical protein